MAYKFMTADGPRLVRSWGYLLQSSGKGGATKKLSAKDLKSQSHDLIVMDFSKDGSDKGAFSEADIASLKQRKGANSVIVSYISIGEASDFRDHWQDNWTKYTDADQRAAGDPTNAAPAWLGAWNENWPNSRKVRYWDKDWQKIIFNSDGTGWLDKIVAAGFDGAYLDIIDGYYHWGCVVPKTAECRADDPQTEREAAARMIDFVVSLSTMRARRTRSSSSFRRTAPISSTRWKMRITSAATLISTRSTPLPAKTCSTAATSRRTTILIPTRKRSTPSSSISSTAARRYSRSTI